MTKRKQHKAEFKARVGLGYSLLDSGMAAPSIFFCRWTCSAGAAGSPEGAGMTKN